MIVPESGPSFQRVDLAAVGETVFGLAVRNVAPERLNHKNSNPLFPMIAGLCVDVGGAVPLIKLGLG